ncbi:hypothetical protein BJ138DRAFT_1178301, partial [Hygrophoropsis aurantiaca]
MAHHPEGQRATTSNYTKTGHDDKRGCIRNRGGICIARPRALERVALILQHTHSPRLGAAGDSAVSRACYRQEVWLAAQERDTGEAADPCWAMEWMDLLDDTLGDDEQAIRFRRMFTFVAGMRQNLYSTAAESACECSRWCSIVERDLRVGNVCTVHIVYGIISAQGDVRLRIFTMRPSRCSHPETRTKPQGWHTRRPAVSREFRVKRTLDEFRVRVAAECWGVLGKEVSLAAQESDTGEAANPCCAMNSAYALQPGIGCVLRSDALGGWPQCFDITRAWGGQTDRQEVSQHSSPTKDSAAEGSWLAHRAFSVEIIAEGPDASRLERQRQNGHK